MSKKEGHTSKLGAPPWTTSMWGEGLQEHIEQGAFCPLMLSRKLNVDVQKGNACPEKLLTEAPCFQLDIRLCRNVLDDPASIQIVLLRCEQIEKVILFEKD